MSGIGLRIIDPSNQTHEVPRAQRKGLTWDSVVPGGDEGCSWESPCNAGWLLDGIPRQDSRVEVYDTDPPLDEDGDPEEEILWVGRLHQPVIEEENGSLTRVLFEAEGYYHSAQDDPFEYRLVYGPPTTGATTQFKVTTTSILTALSHARTQKCPHILGESLMATAVQLEEDSEAFYHRTAFDVWQSMAGLQTFLDFLYWQVYSVGGLVTLEYRQHGGTPDYFERGKAKSKRLEYNANEIISAVRVAYGGDEGFQATRPPVLGGITTRSKAIDLENEIHTLNQATQLADSQVDKLNQIRVTGGSIVLNKPLEVPGIGLDPRDPIRVRAGRMLDVELSAAAAPYTAGLLYIKRYSYSEDACEGTASPSTLSDEAKNARILPFQHSKALTWGLAFPHFNPAARLDPSKMFAIGATVPPARDPAQDPRWNYVIPSAVMSDSQHDFGPTGGVVDPKAIAKNFVCMNFNVVGASDGAGGFNPIEAETAYEGQSAPEMIIERVQIKSLDGTVGSITIAFHHFNRATQATTSNFIGPLSLSSDDFVEHTIASADPAEGAPETRKILNQGDIVTIDVSAITSVKKILVAILGRKSWESYVPPWPQPGWVKRPGTQTYPHSAGYV